MAEFITPESLQAQDAQWFPDGIATPEADKTDTYIERKALMMGIATAQTKPELQDAVAKNADLIKKGQERSLSANIAYDKFNQDQEAAKGAMVNAIVDGDGQTFDTVLQGYQAKSAPTETDIQTAPERVAHEKILTNAVHEDPVQAKLVEDNVDAFGLAEEMQVKKEIIYQALLDANKEYQDESTFGQIRDWAGTFLPLNISTAQVGNLSLGKGGAPKILTGDRFNEEANKLMSLPLDEFKKTFTEQYLPNLKNGEALFGSNPVIRQSVLNDLLTYSNSRAGLDNVFAGLDAAGLGFSALKSVRSLTRVMNTLGSRVGSAELTASKLMQLDTGKSSLHKFIENDDAITDSLPSAFTPITELVGSNAPEAVKANIDKYEAIANRLNNIQRSSYLDDAEKVKAIQRESEKVGQRVTPQGLSIADVQLVSTPNSTTTEMGIKIGKKDGTGWAKEANARSALARAGYDLNNIDVVQGADKRFYPVLKTIAEGNGLTAPATPAELRGGAGGSWKRFVSHTDATDLPELERVKTAGAYTEGFLDRKVFTPLMRPIREIGIKDKEHLASIIEVNRDLGKDLSYTELAAEWKRVSGKPITDKQASAYYALKQLSNVNYAILNRTLREDLSNKGFKGITFANFNELSDRDYKGIIARTVENLPVKGQTRIYNASENKVYGAGKLTNEDLQTLRQEGYQLLEIHQDINVHDAPITHILAKNSDYTQKELPLYLLNYKDGTIGSRLYSGKYFVKQPVVKEFPEGGKYRARDLTHSVAKTKLDAEAYVTRYNDALEALKNYDRGLITRTEAEDIIGTRTNFETLDEMQKAIDDGLISDQPMQVVRDGERPKFGGGETEMYSNNELSDLTQSFYSQGKAIYSSRGERLASATDEKADVLDVYSSLTRGASTAIRSAAFDVYKKKAIDKWYTTAKEMQVLKNPTASPLEAILDKDPYVKDISFDTQSKLETMRMSIQRTLGARTQSEEYAKQFLEHIGNWMENKPFGKKIAPKLYDLSSANPLAALRGFAFNVKLGLFSPAQLIVQPSTMFSAISIAPKEGLQAFSALPWVRMALVNGSDNVLDYLAKTKGIAAMHGMKPEEFKLYIKELKNSGIADVGSNLAVLNQEAETFINNSKVNLGARDFVSAGQFFFKEAEVWNQLVAHGIAWRKATAKFPDKRTETARAWIKSETNRLSMSMKSTSSAYWQKGILSYPTQFLAYTERMMNNMMPAFLGGNPNFTGGEKARLALGQAIYYGKFGIPMGSFMYKSLASAFGMKEDDAKEYAGGAVDYALKHALGVDASLSARVGVAGQNLSDTIDHFADGQFLDVVGGPTYTISRDMGDQIIQMIKMTTADSLEAENIDSVDKLVLIGDMAAKVATKNISAMSQAYRAMWLYNYGQYITRSGRSIADQVDIHDLQGDASMALATALSLQPNEVVRANELYKENKVLSDDENKLVGFVADYFREYAGYLRDGDTVKAEEVAKKMQLLYLGLPANHQQRMNMQNSVVKRVTGDSEYRKRIDDNYKLKGNPILEEIK